MRVRPLHDRLIVRQIEQDETARGGIVIPGLSKATPQKGEVLAVRDGRIRDNGPKIAPDVKAGDRVLFRRHSGSEIKIEGEDVLILREDDILAIVR